MVLRDDDAQATSDAEAMPDDSSVSVYSVPAYETRQGTVSVSLVDGALVSSGYSYCKTAEGGEVRSSMERLRFLTQSIVEVVIEESASNLDLRVEGVGELGEGGMQIEVCKTKTLKIRGQKDLNMSVGWPLYPPPPSSSNPCPQSAFPF